MIRVVGERTYNLSARIIHAGMWLYQIVRFRKPVKVYNHWLIWDGIQVIEATAEGVEINERKLKSEHVVFYFEGNDLYARSQKNKKYEKINFFWYFIEIFTGKYYGSKTDREHYCIELCTRQLKVNGYECPVHLNPVNMLEYCKNHTLK